MIKLMLEFMTKYAGMHPWAADVMFILMLIFSTLKGLSSIGIRFKSKKENPKIKELESELRKTRLSASDKSEIKEQLDRLIMKDKLGIDGTRIQREARTYLIKNKFATVHHANQAIRFLDMENGKAHVVLTTSDRINLYATITQSIIIVFFGFFIAFMAGIVDKGGNHSYVGISIIICGILAIMFLLSVSSQMSARKIEKALKANVK